MPPFNLVLTIVATTLCASSFAISFDCRRDGQSCTNPGTNLCNYVTGACICLNGRSGYNCAIGNDAIVPQANCATCQNGGTCYNSGTGPKCFCSQEFTGTNCQFRRVRINKCQFDSIEATIDTHGEFDGEMAFMYKFGGINGVYQYVDSSTGSSSCNTTDQMKVTVIEQGDKIGTKDDHACVNRIDDFPSVGWLTAEFAVSVQYNKDIWGDLDHSFLFRCSYNKQDNKTVGVVLEQTLTPVTTESPPFVLLQFYIAEAGDVPIKGDQVKSDPRVLTVALDSSGVVKDFAVKECTAYSNESDFSTGSKLSIVVDKCYDRAAGAYFKRMDKTTVNPSKKLIQMDFTVFKFKSSDKITFNCVISLCHSTADSRCAPRPCSGVDQFGRRRRDIPGDTAYEEQTVNLTVRVLDTRPTPSAP